MTSLRHLGTTEDVPEAARRDVQKSIFKHLMATFIQEEFAFAMRTTAIPRPKETILNPIIRPILNFQNYINTGTIAYDF